LRCKREEVKIALLFTKAKLAKQPHCTPTLLMAWDDCYSEPASAIDAQ